MSKSVRVGKSNLMMAQLRRPRLIRGGSSLAARLIIFCVILSGEYLAFGNIWTVSDTSDNASDTGSLRYCIANAAAADTIQFASSLAGKKITLASTLPSITKPLTIAGLGASQLTIDGGNAYAVLNLSRTANSTISEKKIKEKVSVNVIVILPLFLSWLFWIK